MTQEGPSKIKKRKGNPAFIKAGTLASLANQKRSWFTSKTTDPGVQSNKEGLVNMIEEPQYLAVVTPVQSEPTTPAAQAIEKQVQPDVTTPIEDEQCEELGHSVQKGKRGKTKMKTVHGRHDRKLIVLNDLHRPVGPTEAVVQEFGSFLGTLARNATLCPLDVFDWRKMDTKDDIWEYTLGKYDIPVSGKKWAFEVVQNAWRRHKSRLKKDHFDAYDTDEIRMQNIPEDVPASQFKELLKYWNSEKLQKMSKTNIENRKKVKNLHTVGRKSFALIQHEKQKKTSDPLSAKDIPVAAKKRKPGQSYKCSDEDTTSKIAEMEEFETQQNEDDDGPVNAFASVMGPEHLGCMRLYERGVTETSLEEKVNAAFDLQWEKMQKIMEERMATLRQEVVADVLALLRRSGIEINANTSLAALASPGEASSAQRAVVQPIHHSSTGSSNENQLTSGDSVFDEDHT